MTKRRRREEQRRIGTRPLSFVLSTFRFNVWPSIHDRVQDSRRIPRNERQKNLKESQRISKNIKEYQRISNNPKLRVKNPEES